MTKLIPRTADPSRPDTRAGNGAAQPAQPPSKARRAAERAARLAPGSGWVDGRKRTPDSPMARALAILRTHHGRTIRGAAEACDVDPKSLYQAARRCNPPLPNPYGTEPKGRKPGSHSEPAMGTAGDRYQLRLPEPARAVARHLGAARMRHLLLTVGAALQQRAQEAEALATETRAAGGRLGLVAPAVTELHARPLVITLPPIPRPARPIEHARSLALPDPDQPAAPPQTLTARQARAASRAAALAPVDAMATAQGLPALTDTLACLGRVVAACRRMAADGRMPANVGALRDACRLLGVPHLTTSPTTPREPQAPATARK